MQIHTDETIEKWGNIFVKHRVFNLTRVRFCAFLAASNNRKRYYINAAIAKHNQLTNH